MSSWNNLFTTTMDSISVKGDIVNVEANTTHVLFAKDTLLDGSLETSNNAWASVASQL